MAASDPEALTIAMLRRYGEWKETGWAYVPGPPSTAQKVFQWNCDVVVDSAVHPHPLTLRYFGTARLPTARMEDLEAVARAEREGLAILYAMVAKAIEGSAYVKRPDLVGSMQLVVIAKVREWAEKRQYPTDYDAELATVITSVAQQYDREVRACRKYGAEEDPEHADWGLRVRIKPLAGRVVIAGGST